MSCSPCILFDGRAAASEPKGLRGPRHAAADLAAVLAPRHEQVLLLLLIAPKKSNYFLFLDSESKNIVQVKSRLQDFLASNRLPYSPLVW